MNTITGKITTDNRGKGKANGLRFIGVTDNAGFKHQFVDRKGILKTTYETTNLDGVAIIIMYNEVYTIQYGRQLVIEAVKMQESGTLRFFFVTGLKGFGVKKYDRLVRWAKSAEELQKIIERKDTEGLKMAPGIGPIKAQLIIDTWPQYCSTVELEQELAGCPVSARVLFKIIAHWGSTAAERIRRCPYHVADIPGVGFKIADRIALARGGALNDQYRIKYALSYAIKELAWQKGDTLIERQVLIGHTAKLLFGDTPVLVSFFAIINSIINMLVEKGMLIQFDTALSSRTLYNSERKILDLTMERLNTQPVAIMSPAQANIEIARIERKQGFAFDADQRMSIQMAAAGYFMMILCGYAGTGKSTVAKAILDIISTVHDDDSIICVALSGKAADRIRNTTGRKAVTIHSALGYGGAKDIDEEDINLGEAQRFRYNNKTKLPYSVVLLDEASMVSSTLILSLMTALPDNAIFILLGDDAQLPPIGEGQPFCDFIQSGLLPMVQLTEIHRQHPDSVLTTLAAQIRDHKVPENYDKPGHRDFQFLPVNSDQDIQNAIIDEAIKAVKLVKNPLCDVQILSPMHKGLLGTDALNQRLQEALNPYNGSEVISQDSVRYSRGDKVLHTQNDNRKIIEVYEYDRNGWSPLECGEQRIYNGNVGVIRNVDPEQQTVYVEYPGLCGESGHIVEYNHLELGDMIKLAYAITIHKSQGAEYERTIIPMSSSHNRMLNSKLAYTAITRASGHCQLVGQPNTFENACTKMEEQSRKTVLAEMMDHMATQVKTLHKIERILSLG